MFDKINVDKDAHVVEVTNGKTVYAYSFEYLQDCVNFNHLDLFCLILRDMSTRKYVIVKFSHHELVLENLAQQANGFVKRVTKKQLEAILEL